MQLLYHHVAPNQLSSVNLDLHLFFFIWAEFWYFVIRTLLDGHLPPFQQHHWTWWIHCFTMFLISQISPLYLRIVNRFSGVGNITTFSVFNGSTHFSNSIILLFMEFIATSFSVINNLRSALSIFSALFLDALITFFPGFIAILATRPKTDFWHLSHNFAELNTFKVSSLLSIAEGGLTVFNQTYRDLIFFGESCSAYSSWRMNSPSTLVEKRNPFASPSTLPTTTMTVSD